MPGRFWFGLGMMAMALVWPGSQILGHIIFRRSVLYPH